MNSGGSLPRSPEAALLGVSCASDRPRAARHTATMTPSFAELLLGAMDLDSSVGPVNIGSGIGTTVRALAELILRQIPSAGGIIREDPRDGALAGDRES